MGKKKILVIDDEKDFCILVKKSLEVIGDFDVLAATSGKDGLKIAKKTAPDLILLDVIMPGMDGLEVLEKLKKDKDTLSIPVVMLTAVQKEEAKIKATQSFDEEYITKPIAADVLKEKIEEVFKRRGQI